MGEQRGPEWIRNVGRPDPALVISQEPGATATGNPALAVSQADPAGAGIRVRSAGTLLDLQDPAGTSKLKIDSAGAQSPFPAAFGISQLYGAPAGANGETIARPQATVVTAGVAVSGTVYLSAIFLPAGITVSNITMVSGTTTLKTGGVHGWYCLADSARVVRAATADQTDAATVWGTASTAYTLPVNAFLTTYTGLYYTGIMVATSAGTQPNMVAGAAMGAGLGAISPILSGPCTGGTGTGQTTPPATDGSVTLTLSSDSSKRWYAYTS